MTNAITDFLEAMCAAGITPLEPIEDKLATGRPVRFRAEGDKPGRLNGWAWLHLDAVPAGVFRHYRLGIRKTWRAGSGPRRRLSPQEQRGMLAQTRGREARRKAATEAKQKTAAQAARDLWQRAGKPDPAHGYLVRKHLSPFGVRQHGTALLVPMLDRDFRLWNVQRVYGNGRKLFLKDGRTEGLFWSHAALWEDGRPSAGPLVIGEGYATMAVIHSATGYGVAAALSARNLETVARIMRSMFPTRELILAADDDQHLPSNIGVEAARTAAEAVGGSLAVPRTRNSSGHSAADFADIPRQDVAACIAAAGAGNWS